MELFSYSPLASFQICFLLRQHWPIIAQVSFIYANVHISTSVYPTASSPPKILFPSITIQLISCTYFTLPPTPSLLHLHSVSLYLHFWGGGCLYISFVFVLCLHKEWEHKGSVSDYLTSIMPQGTPISSQGKIYIYTVEYIYSFEYLYIPSRQNTEPHREFTFHSGEKLFQLWAEINI